MIGAIVAGMLSAPTPPVTSSWESIESFTVGSGGTSAITFGSGGTIPQTYKHLQIRATARMAASATLDSLWAQFNSDTTASNYYAHGIYGTGSGTPGAYADSGAFAQIGILSAANAGSNMFGSFIMDILDYQNTNKYKTTRTLSGADLNGDGQLRFVSGLWRNTNAITSLRIAGNSNFAQYSSFALYGIKG